MNSLVCSHENKIRCRRSFSQESRLAHRPHVARCLFLSFCGNVASPLLYILRPLLQQRSLARPNFFPTWPFTVKVCQRLGRGTGNEARYKDRKGKCSCLNSARVGGAGHPGRGWPSSAGAASCPPAWALAVPFLLEVQLPEGILTVHFMGSIYIFKVSSNFKEATPYKSNDTSTF